MNCLKRLFCFFGFHKWEVRDISGAASFVCCIRCRKEDYFEK